MIVALLCLLSGMILGSVLVIVIASLFTMNKVEFEAEYDDVHAKYVALLEHQVWGQSNPDIDTDDDYQEDDDL